MNWKHLPLRLRKWHRRHQLTGGYPSWYRNVLSRCKDLQDLPEGPVPGESEWLQRWRHYDRSVKPYSYRIFSHYIGFQPDIAPLELIAGIVEPVLNPPELVSYYQDKNSFDKVYAGLPMPATLLRCIEGTYFDASYHVVTDLADVAAALQTVAACVVKPTQGYGGEGIRRFIRQGDQLIDRQGTPMDVARMRALFGNDFIVQNLVEQSPFIAHLNASSVNTIRIATYRDVKTEAIRLLGAVIRVGAQGNEVDNVHAGGRFIGVDLATGLIGQRAMDDIGESVTTFNGVDYKDSLLTIPHWDQVLSLARQVAQRNPHHRLLALDIALKSDDQPLLIEANVEAFGAWIFQYASGPVFGQWTEEIFDYCYPRYLQLRTRIVYTKSNNYM